MVVNASFQDRITYLAAASATIHAYPEFSFAKTFPNMLSKPMAVFPNNLDK